MADKFLKEAVTKHKKKQETMIHFYDSAFRRYQGDLIDRYGARDFVVFEGNSMLYTLLHTKSLDWTHGGQYLHLTYLLERLVKGLVDREIKFDVVFCTSLESHFENSPLDMYSVKLAHKLLIQHLGKLNIQCEMFDIWSTKDGIEQWDDYYKKKYPAFVVGTYEVDCARLFLFYCNLRYKLKFVTDITFHGSTLLGYVGSQTGTLKEGHVYKLIKENNEKYRLSDSSVVYQTEYSIIQHLKLVCSDQKTIASIVALRSIIKHAIDTNLYNQLAQLLLLTLLLQKSLPLQYRAQHINYQSDTIANFINEYSRAIYEQLGDQDYDLYDLIDGRLMYSLCFGYAECAKNARTKLLLISTDHLCESDRILFERVIPLFSNDEKKMDQKIWRNMFQNLDGKTIVQSSETVEKKLFPISHAMVNTFLGDTWESMFSYHYADSDIVMNATKDSMRFTELYHWHSTRKLDNHDDFVPKTIQQKEKQKNSQERLKAYSDSLARSDMRKNINVKVQNDRLDINHKTELQKLHNLNNSIKKKIAELDQERMKTKGHREKSFQINNLLHEANKKLKEVFERIYRMLLAEHNQLQSLEKIQSIDKTLKEFYEVEEQREKLMCAVINIKNEPGKQSEDTLDPPDDWEELDIDSIGSTIPQEQKPVKEIQLPDLPKIDLNKLIKERKQLLDNISQIDSRLDQLRERVIVVQQGRYLLEDCIIKLLQDLATLYVKELSSHSQVKRSTDEICWDGFEAFNLLYEYITAIEGIEYNKMVNLRSGTDVTIRKLANRQLLLQSIADGLYSLGFSQYARDLLHTVHEIQFPDPMNEAPVQPSSAVYQLLHNARCASCKDYLPPDELEKFEEYKYKADKMFSLGFRPDDWQQTLIDHVETNKSVLVSAPTSSGKTFIAFYVIEKVLRESDTGVVVFVCPTKALVNQIYAEIYSMYSKSDGFIGMFTAENKIHVTTCQVLVTVPACMEILLLTAVNLEWKNNLKYVILDEIHCISDAESGSVWEHILLMIKCPFVALSATIGNIEEFGNWLNWNKKNVEIVEYQDRPRPLEYFAYDHMGKQLIEMHPCATINLANISVQYLKNLYTMSPRQCYDLYYTAELVAAKLSVPNLLDGLSPEDALPRFGLYTRNDFNQYSNKLKQRLVEVADNTANHSILANIFRQLDHAIVSEDQQDKFDYYYLQNNIYPLVQQLTVQDLLPSISFSFDRRLCLVLAKEVCRKLVQNKTNLWNNPAQATECKNKINDVLKKISKDEKIPRELLDALNHGVACHYAGLPDTYCTEVERLFRMKCIPIVFATSTLALGINMPCKTVLITGQSVYLTTVLFNQCSGRAGRRGFDNKGRVVLFGLPRIVSDRLMTADIPKIHGSMGLSHSFILRVMTYVNECFEQIGSNYSKKEEFIFDTIALLEQPLFAVGQSGELLKLQVKHQFRYTLEVLMRLGYMSSTGSSVDFTGLVSHLFFHEPSNFVLVEFIRKHLFHSLLQDETLTDEQKEMAVLNTLCYLFVRVPVRANAAQSNGTKLAPLRVEFVYACKDYQNSLLSIYKEYMKSYASNMRDHILDNQLPMSHLAASSEIIQPLDLVKASTKNFDPVFHLSKYRIHYEACSSFAVLSGNTDDFNDLGTMTETLNHNILFDLSLIPNLDMNQELSSFVMDYYKNIDLKSLKVKHDLFSENEIYNHITQFGRDLSKIHSSLMLMSVKRKDPFLQVIKKLKRELRAKLAGFSDYEHMLGLGSHKTKRYPAIKLGKGTKTVPAEIILSLNLKNGRPTISILIDNEFDQKSQLNPKYFRINPKPLSGKYVREEQSSIVYVKITGVEYKYSLTSHTTRQLLDGIKEFLKMFKPVVKPIYDRADKPRYEQKRSEIDESWIADSDSSDDE
jgi:hypothetical protein